MVAKQYEQRKLNITEKKKKKTFIYVAKNEYLLGNRVM